MKIRGWLLRVLWSLAPGLPSAVRLFQARGTSMPLMWAASLFLLVLRGGE